MPVGGKEANATHDDLGIEHQMRASATIERRGSDLANFPLESVGDELPGLPGSDVLA